MKNASPLRLLFLEDDADTRAMVTVALRQSDIEVHTVDTVDEALRLVDRQTYQAYLLDGMVPDGDSLRLCRALRARFPTRPVIFYSGLGFSTDLQKAMDAGASDYLVKPFLGDLGKVVRDLVTEAAAMGSGSSPDDKIGH
jgi:DNA-binding response OmpR family regulator